MVSKYENTILFKTDKNLNFYTHAVTCQSNSTSLLKRRLMDITSSAKWLELGAEFERTI